jgi:glucokinase
MEQQPILVGDVGGTKTRFAVAETIGIARWSISHRIELAGDFPDLPAALRAYFNKAGLDSIPEGAVVAASGPVTAGKVRLTNRQLEISEDELTHFGFEHVLLINDFAALAFAAEVLGPEDLHPIGSASPGIAGRPISVLGAGTGFGVSCLVRNRGGAIALTTEGGHIGFAPGDSQQMAVLSAFQQRFGRVSVERILCGHGLEGLHRTMDEFAGREHQPLSADMITAAALNGDGACQATVSLWLAIYGAVAGDIALVHGAQGGVLVAGGIAPKIEPLLRASQFREWFERKGRLSGFVKAIPTHLIINPDATLIGAARAGLETWG